MSLINDALKKAQKQRTGETPSLASMPSVGGETPHRIAKRAKPAGFETLVIRAGIGAGVILVLAIGAFFLFRDKPTTGGPASLRAASDPAIVAVQPSGPQGRGPSTETNPPVSAPASTPAPAFTLPVAPKPEPVAQVPVAGVADPGPASPRPATSVPSPAPTGSDPRVSPFSPGAKPRDESPAALAKGGASQVSEPAKPALKLEPRAIQFIENIKVAGIMARPTDSKVLMNDRVYRIGSLVEAEMGLTLVGITANSLTFEDGNGGRYTRTF